MVFTQCSNFYFCSRIIIFILWLLLVALCRCCFFYSLLFFWDSNGLTNRFVCCICLVLVKWSTRRLLHSNESNKFSFYVCILLRSAGVGRCFEDQVKENRWNGHIGLMIGISFNQHTNASTCTHAHIKPTGKMTLEKWLFKTHFTI